MICPHCHSDYCRRSRRRSLADYLVGACSVRPWRCQACGRRFFAGLVPVRYLAYAHCGVCGNFELRRIAREHVHMGWFAWLGRLLHLPAYRCDLCRNRFLSLLPRCQIRAAPAEEAASEEVAGEQLARPS